MIYRFKSPLAIQDRLEAFPVPSLESGKDHYGPWFTDYENIFAPVKSTLSVIGCQQFEAPLYHRDGIEKYSLSFQFHRNNDFGALPDIWSVGGYIIVSAKARAAIESVDSMTHEYLPFSWLNCERELLPVDQDYFWFNPRRFFTIEPSAHIAEYDQLGFFPLETEEDFLGRLLDTPELQNHLSQFPLWRHYRLTGVEGRHSQARMVLYFNDELYQAFKAAGVQGVELLNQPLAGGEESVCQLGGEG